ncbi:unnamed protein product [Brachionus calyciflorus]|uniref:Transcription termination factor 2 n=1 Tax=Brachionus calyciflorus TaxID=104777 RepID=A0A814BCI8_9BILA|nr:unnamed protein product [Brachionus calyciflorus]
MNRYDAESIFINDSIDDDKENSFKQMSKKANNLNVSGSPLVDLSYNSEKNESVIGKTKRRNKLIIADSFEQDNSGINESKDSDHSKKTNTIEDTEDEDEKSEEDEEDEEDEEEESDEVEEYKEKQQRSKANPTRADLTTSYRQSKTINSDDEENDDEENSNEDEEDEEEEEIVSKPTSTKRIETDDEDHDDIVTRPITKKLISEDEDSEEIIVQKNTKNVLLSDEDSYEKNQKRYSNEQEQEEVTHISETFHSANQTTKSTESNQVRKKNDETMFDDSFGNIKSNITHFGKTNQNDSIDIIELSDSETNDIASSTQYNLNLTSKTPSKTYKIFENVKKSQPTPQKEEKQLSSWSPNYEKVKASIKAKMEQNAPRKIEVIDLDDEEIKKVDKVEVKAQKYEAPLKNTNRYMDNRSLYHEEKLKILSDRMIEVMEEKPEPGKWVDGKNPEGLKVTLLPHQHFSMLWLKWREGSYPNGGILADDMGLGKTLTILTYLKLVKDEREAKMMAKLNKEEDDDDDNDDELTSNEYLKRIKSKKKSKKCTYRLKTLIVLPASLLYQWQGEIESKFERDSFKIHVYHDANRKRHAYNLEDNDLVFTTYEIVSREVEFDKEGNLVDNDSPLTRIKWKRIILDEAHRIKNHTTKANKAMCALKAKYRIAITGTPIHNSLNDLYSLIKFVHFAPLDDIGLWKYVFADEKASNKNNPSSIERQKRMNSWMVFLSDYMILRRTKADKLHGTDKKIVDLPDKNIEIVKVKLNSEEKAIYEKIFNESKEKVKSFLQNQQNRLLGKSSNAMSGSAVSEIFVYLLRLRQACCHLSLLSECLDKNELQAMKLEAQDLNDIMEGLTLNSTSADPAQKFTNLTHCLKKNYVSSKIGKLVEMIEEFLDEYPEDKLIVVSQWTSVLNLVSAYLKKNQIEFCEITGEVNLMRRNEIVEYFNKKNSNDLRVMLLSLTAGGVGLNLVGANRMFIVDIHWNPALEQQAMDRIYRVGQKKECFIYRFLCENTIEERIEEIQHHKLQLAQKVCGASAANIPGMASVGNGKLTLHDFKLLFKDFDNKD